MQLKQRIKRIEQRMPMPVAIQEAKECKHPSADFDFYKDYPATGYEGERSVVKGHCNICGFDDYLWSFNALTEEQEQKRWELRMASQFWAGMEYDLSLINQNLLCYTPWSRISEVKEYYGKSAESN